MSYDFDRVERATRELLIAIGEDPEHLPVWRERGKKSFRECMKIPVNT